MTEPTYEERLLERRIQRFIESSGKRLEIAVKLIAGTLADPEVETIPTEVLPRFFDLAEDILTEEFRRQLYHKEEESEWAHERLTAPLEEIK